ncbi:hypothetical protein B0H13DRAFT_1611967, partial [Mycena leptocephala]
QALEGTSLDDSGLDADTIDRLRNPLTESADISDNKDFRLSLDIYLADTSEATYEATRQGIRRHSPDVEMLSQIGVVPITHDMCPNSCVAYTTHWAELEECPKCSSPHYDPLHLQDSDGGVSRNQGKY